VKYGRTILQDVEGYVPGEQPRTQDVIKLNTNENPYPPSPKVLEALRALPESSVRKYPEPLAMKLREACAERFGCPGADWVVAGNGMDELLALAVRTFTDPGDTILSPYPTYILYETLAKLHGAEIKLVDLDERFRLTEEFYETKARLTFLPRPNSPSGVCAPREAVERLCRESDGIVVIDEAYVDFGDGDCMDFPKRFENAIVMRTFSKSFSLAGMRVGVAVARPELIGEFMKTKDSYNLNAFSQAAGLAAFTDYDYMLANADKVGTTRQHLVAGLKELGFEVPESQANFVLAKWAGEPSAREIYLELKARGIFVRYFNARRLDDALRITVGTDAEIEALLSALREVISD
jgi:histidinol-phosphate aminotransferase